MKTSTRSLLLSLLALVLLLALVPVAPAEPAARFEPTWDSLEHYEFPTWFRDVKFGIWAHMGPQVEPEASDWYARNMYVEGHKQNKFHLEHYGHPSAFGFKDVINEWHLENFDADALIAFYKKSGARYFMALANHHDNLDNYDSIYQPWNSVAMGPKKDVIGLWAAAAKKHGLRFGVSVHASRAWSWYEVAQSADKSGPLAGVPYDGRLTQADGVGKWWEGFDPQDLYAQSHVPGAKLEWSWDPRLGSSVPDYAYMEKFYNRTVQLWDDYQPDQIYFDDTVMPFYGITDDIGLRLAAHFYNSSIARHGQNEAVMNGKKLDANQRRVFTYDIERGKAEGILPEPWQTDTCIGHWHYDRKVFENHSYKGADVVIPMLADIVSKNGNLMLSVPIRGDGTLDEDEIRIVSEIGDWLRLNGEAIYATRPWQTYGEGPSTTRHEKGHFDGQSDTSSHAFTAADIRYTRSKDSSILYAIVLAWPENHRVTLTALATTATTFETVTSAALVGHDGLLKFTRDETGLHVNLPAQAPGPHAFVIKLATSRNPMVKPKSPTSGG